MDLGEYTATSMRAMPVDFRMTMPFWFTSAGRKGWACATRFWAFTWSRLTSVDTSKVTVSLMVPSLALVDCM